MCFGGDYMANAIAKSIERRKLILSGNLWKTILIVCFPLALYQFFNSLGTLIDQIICASISTEASNAVGSIAQLKNTISAFGAGLAAGGAVLVSRYFGSGDLKNAKKTSGNLFVLSLIISTIIIVLFIPLAKPIMRLCQISDKAIEIGYLYFILQLFELALVSINSVFIGLEKAKGNSKMILYLNVGALIVKLGLSALFIYGLKFDDILWVEVATMVSQAIITGIGLYFMFRKNNILQITPKDFKLEKELIKPILLISLPIFFGKFIMNVGKLSVNAICGYFYNSTTDALIVGALGISNNISGLSTGITTTFEDSESTVVSQNIGNKNLKRSIKFFIRLLAVSLVISITGYVLTRFVFVDQLVKLFQGDDNKGAYYSQMIKEIYNFDSLSIIALGICSTVLGLLYGYGKTFLATILNFSRIAIRIVTILIMALCFPNISGPTCAGIAMGISNISILILSLIFFVIFFNALRKQGFMGMHLTDPEPAVSELEL